MERYFGPRLWEAGYFPVVVHVENRGENALEIDRSEFSVERPREPEADSWDSGPVSPGTVYDSCRRGRAMAYAAMALLVVPGLWLDREIETFNFDMVRDLSHKSLPPRTRVEPGDPPLQATLYFRRPEEPIDLAEFLRNAEIHATVRLEGSEAGAAVALPEEHAAEGSPRVGDSITVILPLEEDEE